MSRHFRLAAALCASALTIVSASARASGGAPFDFPGLRPPPPPPPEPDGATGFDVARKPPIPVSFLSHDGGWIQFQYPPSARDRAASLIAVADDLRAELAEALGQMPLDGVEVRIARGPEEMGALTPEGPTLLPDARSTSYPKLKLIVLSLGSSSPLEPAELVEGFRRELARLSLDEAVGGRSLPEWFGRGLGVRFSGEGEWSRDLQLYRAAVAHRTFAVSELDRALRDGRAGVALAEAADLVDFMLRPEMRSRFTDVIGRLRQGDGFEDAVAGSYGTSMSSIEQKWRARLGRHATLATILLGIAIPGACMLGYAAFRAWRRRRARSPAKLAAKKAALSSERPRVHIVFSRRDDRIEPPVLAESEIPKVEHEGEWHTLH